MGQYEQLLNTALVFIGRHDIVFSVGFLLTTQGAIWWMLARAISRIDQATPMPPQMTLAAPELVAAADTATEPVARAVVAPIHGNLILTRLVTDLRDEFSDPGCSSAEHVSRWQRRLARHGVVPPRTVAECDALLPLSGDRA